MADEPELHEQARQTSARKAKERREAVAKIAERNAAAHKEAKKKREARDRERLLRRGPNDR